MWGFLAAGLAKTTGREIAEPPRRAGATRPSTQEPQAPITNVVPSWLAVLAGVAFGAMLLGIVAFALRLHSHRATGDEATAGMVWSAALCGLPGAVLAVAAWRGFRKNARLRAAASPSTPTRG